MGSSNRRDTSRFVGPQRLDGSSSCSGRRGTRLQISLERLPDGARWDSTLNLLVFFRVLQAALVQVAVL